MARKRGFNSATAKEAGRKSGQARRARKAKHELAAREASTLIESTNGDLGPLARVTAASVMSRVLSGEIPVRNGSDAANVLKVAHDVARLEVGEPTAITLSASLSSENIAEVAKRLRQRVLESAETLDPAPAIEPAHSEQSAPPGVDGPGPGPSTDAPTVNGDHSAPPGDGPPASDGLEA